VLLGQTWLAADGLTVVDTLSFSYTSDGLLLSASNGVGAYTFSWTDGVLTGVTNPFGVTLTFGYDSDGRRTSVADSFGGQISSTYTDGLLASRTLTAGAVHLRVDLGYDSAGRLSQISRFAGPLQELVSQTEYAFAQGCSPRSRIAARAGSSSTSSSTSSTRTASCRRSPPTSPARRTTPTTVMGN
jgi:YD repeat-containing protein